MKYFSYDYENGIEFHSTPEEAKKRAEDCFSNANEYACEYGWDGQEDQICWGSVSEKVSNNGDLTPIKHDCGFEYIQNKHLA